MSSSGPDIPPPLHEVEAEVMEEVWRLGEATVRDVLAALNEHSDKQRAYTTIMTVLARLERKGILERRKEGKGFVYAPRATREDYLEARAEAAVEALVDEFGEVALVNFAKQMSKIDGPRREQLRRLARRG
ncbi:MAG: BlaI/MecI/CopY family transcriptional regulator [Solirubrobacteraceae bacterium]